MDKTVCLCHDCEKDPEVRSPSNYPCKSKCAVCHQKIEPQQRQIYIEEYHGLVCTKCFQEWICIKK